MPTLEDVRTERATVWSSMKDIIERASAEGRDLTVDEKTTYDNAEKDLDRLTGEMGELEADATRAKRHAEREAEMRKVDRTGVVVDEPSQTEEDKAYSKAFVNYVRFGNNMDPVDRQVLAKGYNPDVTNALSATTGSAGGYTVPPRFRDILIETMKWYGSVRSVATTIDDVNGAPLQWPTFNGTAQIGRILAENTQLTQTDPAFNTAVLNAYMYSSDLTLVPYQFLQDTNLDAEEFLARILGTRIGRIQNQHFTTGTGTAQPTGIQTNAAAGVTLPTGNTTTVTYAGLVALIHSVDPAYRYGVGNQGDSRATTSAQFMLSDTALAAIRSIVDTQQRPLWQPSLQAGQPDTILGYGYVVNNDMPVPAASVKSVLFGDFKKGYVVRDVLGVSVRRLDERYADFLQVGWFAFARADATPQDVAAYKALVQSAT